MKIYYLFFILLFTAGCASSEKKQTEEYTNLVQIEKPEENTPHRPSSVYIDSVKKITHQDNNALLIYGTFPDACTKLSEVNHTFSNDMLKMRIKAWRNPKIMCAQVLTPFTYIYDGVNDQYIFSHTQVFINGTTYIY